MIMRHVLNRAGGNFAKGSQRRTMGGGPFPYGLNVKKNKYVEEWNGRREITEKAFQATADKVFTIVICCCVIPFGIYSLGRSELKKTGGRRYNDIC